MHEHQPCPTCGTDVPTTERRRPLSRGDVVRLGDVPFTEEGEALIQEWPRLLHDVGVVTSVDQGHEFARVLWDVARMEWAVRTDWLERIGAPRRVVR